MCIPTRMAASCAAALLIAIGSPPPVGARTVTVPEFKDCRSICIGRATEAWSKAAAECESLPPKEQEKCGQRASKIFDQTYRKCLRQQCHITK